MKLSERLYRLLLHLYPMEHRREYGELMAQAFRDLYRKTAKQHSILALCLMWLHIFADTFAAAFIEHRDTRSASGQYRAIHVFIVLFLIIALIFYIYIAHGQYDMAAIYLMILLTGLGARILNKLGLLPANPIWNTYTTGVLFGIAGFAIFILSALPAFGVYLLQFPPVFILITALAIYGTATYMSGWLVGTFRSFYWIIAVLLGLTSVTSRLIQANLADTITLFISLNYALMETLSILLSAAITIYLLRRRGHTTLIMLIVALGVRFTFIDPGYYTGHAGRWIDLAMLLFPLVICPAWWLLAAKGRVSGTIILWALMMGIAAFAPGIARIVLQIGVAETPAVWLSRAIMILPYLIAMALVLYTYTRTLGTVLDVRQLNFHSD
jgi:hypothetical protein